MAKGQATMPQRKPAKRRTTNLGPGVPRNRRTFSISACRRVMIDHVEIRVIGRAKLWFPRTPDAAVRVERIAEKPVDLTGDVA